VKNTTVRLFSILFWIITCIDIAAIVYGSSSIHFFVKPLLIPTLMLLLIYSKTGGKEKWWLLTGLFFSFLGDVFLLYEYKNALFFIFGLASFLITHVFYIIYFLKIKSTQLSLLRQQPWIAALVAGYGCSLVMLLYPGLGDLKIPVIVYAGVICFMLLCSLHIFYKTGRPSNVYFVTGALLFVISDSLLAVNKFLTPFTSAGIFIMLTYCAAQFFIVMGFIKK
jgi:uncharacterized membrane protein YhhN